MLNGILEKAAAISEADVGAAMLRISPAGVGQHVVRAEAIFGEHMAPLSGREFPLVGPPPDARESRQPVLADDFSTMELTESVAAVAQEFGLRSRVSVSLFDDDDWIGNLNLYRHEVRPFGQKQAAVLQAFADQASIAIANARLFNDLDESLERQQAMTDVLDAVSTARFDLQPVVDRIAHHADRLCGGTGVGVSVVYGDHLRPVSGTGHFADGFAANPDLRIPIDASSPVGDSARTGQVVHVRNWDEMADDVYPNAGSRAAGRKSALTVPMVRNDTVVGVFGFSRVEPGGYTDSEISLLQTFANQAAIAVDNARLLTEIEQRNSELSESLELQTATSDILRLISAHPGDLTTVLEGIAGRAATLCDAEVGSVLLRHGDILRIEAESATMEGTQSLVGREFIAERTINRRARDSREPVFLDDFQDVHDSVGIQVARDLPDLHSFATIALLLDDEWIGNLNLSRTEVRPFDPKIAPIMQAFADQAAIAVANAKLFNDLDAALERQTAMTDVLDAVSTARTDLQPVFDRIVEHAQRLCDDTAAFVSVRVEGDVVTVAGAGAGAGADGYLGNPMTRDRERSTTITVYETAEALHIRDWHDVPADIYAESPCALSGMRALLALPMRRHGEVVGVITFMKEAPGGYSDNEISLLQAFTDQAAIAVDNARLLREIEQRNTDLAESLALQTATSEVLQLISANPGDLTIVLEGIITRAAAFCEAETGSSGSDMVTNSAASPSAKPRFSFVGNTTSLAESGANLRAGETKQPFFMDDLVAAIRPGMPLADEILATGVRSFATIPWSARVSGSATSTSDASRFGRSTRSRQRSCRPSPTRRRLRSRTPVCSTTSTRRSSARQR